MNNSKNCWTVYCHTTPSGKRYIGITSKKPEKRWHNGRGYKEGSAFRSAIDKYGWNDIQHNIVSTDLTEKEAKWLENYLICYYWTFVGFKDSKGYNMTLGGEGSLGHVPTEESRRKNSEAHKGQISGMKGKHHTKETKEKMSESSKGITVWNKGKTGVQVAWNKEKQLSEEHKRKIGESNKDKTPWNKGKHWKLIDGKRHYE